MSVPEANVDQAPKGSVPAAEDQIVVPDGKTAISPAAATALKAATGKSLPDNYFVVEDEKPEPVPAPETEGGNQEPEPFPEGEPDPEPEPAEAGTEGETGTPATEPENEPEAVGAPEGQPTLEEDGFAYSSVGALDIRTDKDGNVQVLENIDGEEAWINSDVFKKGYQFNQHNQREAQKLAQEKKDIEKQKGFDSMVDRIAISNRSEPANNDDLWGPDPQPQAQPQASSEVAMLNKRIADLESKGAATEQAKAQSQAEADFNYEVNLAKGEMLDYLDLQKVKHPTDKQLIAMVKEAAENEKIDPAIIAKSPARLISVVKAKLKTRTVPRKASADSTPKPPTGAAPRKSTPLPSATLKAVEDEMEALRAKSKEYGSNSAMISKELIRLNRERNKLIKGG